MKPQSRNLSYRISLSVYMDFDENIYHDYASDVEPVDEDKMYASLTPAYNFYASIKYPDNGSGDAPSSVKYFPPSYSHQLRAAIHADRVDLVLNMIQVASQAACCDPASMSNTHRLTNGRTLLMEACAHFSEHVVSHLVTQCGDSVNTGCVCRKDDNNPPPILGAVPQNTALLLSCASLHPNGGRTSRVSLGMNRSEHVVSSLLRAGACCHCVSQPAGNGPLHCTVLAARSPLVRELLAHGCPVDTQNAACLTPLMLAAEQGAMELCNLLVNAGAQLHIRSLDGHTAAQLALMNGHEEVANCLMDKSQTTGDLGPLYRAWSLLHAPHEAKSLPEDMVSSSESRDVGIFCCGLGLQHLLPSLMDARVSLDSLAAMSETQLHQVGAKKWMERHRVLDMCQRLHKSPWDTKNWPRIHKGEPLLLSVALDLAANTQRHLRLLTAGFVHVEAHLRDNAMAYRAYRPAVLQPVANTMLDLCEDSLHACGSMRESALAVLQLADQMVLRTEPDIFPDVILEVPTEDSIFTRSKWLCSMASVTILAMVAGTVLYRNRQN